MRVEAKKKESGQLQRDERRRRKEDEAHLRSPVNLERSKWREKIVQDQSGFILKARDARKS